MKTALIAILVAICVVGADAQIRRHFDFDASKIYHNRFGGVRVFTGSFDFEQLPAALQQTRVHFNLTAVRGDVPNFDEDWIIKLNYLHGTIRLLSDTIFYWPGPHKEGDIFGGYIEFIPNLSSKWDMDIYWQPSAKAHQFGQIKNGISFYWCINEDGQLIDLGVPGDHEGNLSKSRVFFFDKDSVYISQYLGPYDNELFKYNLIIKPIPKTGDSSTIYLNLKAIKDIVGGCDIRLIGNSISFMKIPSRIDYPISMGQNVKLELGFIPEKVRAVNGINIEFSMGSSIKERIANFQRIHCSFIFNNDGTLRYISTDGLDLIPDDRLPQDFPPPPTEQAPTIIRVNANEGDTIMEKIE